MGENNLFSNFLPNELETNPKIEVEQSASKDTSKYHQLSLFDFVYETGEFIINETNISQVNELPNDIVKNIENEATQENHEDQIAQDTTQKKKGKTITKLLRIKSRVKIF
ncbi:hypothetical protein NVZ75_001593 [Campylobacter upsaliensis]|nr:hypothetical protein [Campylobacter upsaliensis]